MIRQMLELSTANISQFTAMRLDLKSDDVPVTYDKGAYGYWVVVPEKEQIPRNCPKDLRVILEHAIANNCAWIMFDQDADPVSAFQIFEW